MKLKTFRRGERKDGSRYTYPITDQEQSYEGRDLTVYKISPLRSKLSKGMKGYTFIFLYTDGSTEEVPLVAKSYDEALDIAMMKKERKEEPKHMIILDPSLQQTFAKMKEKTIAGAKRAEKAIGKVKEKVREARPKRPFPGFPKIGSGRYEIVDTGEDIFLDTDYLPLTNQAKAEMFAKSHPPDWDITIWGLDIDDRDFDGNLEPHEITPMYEKVITQLNNPNKQIRESAKILLCKYFPKEYDDYQFGITLVE